MDDILDHVDPQMEITAGIPAGADLLDDAMAVGTDIIQPQLAGGVWIPAGEFHALAHKHNALEARAKPKQLTVQTVIKPSAFLPFRVSPAKQGAVGIDIHTVLGSSVDQVIVHFKMFQRTDIDK